MGGIIAGIGLGILLAELIRLRSAEAIPLAIALFLGFVLIGTGTVLARKGQKPASTTE